MTLLAVASISAQAQAARTPFDVELFARVPAPGSPEGIAVDSTGTVYVGTSPKEGGPTGARRPSKVFAYDGAGNLLREYVVTGQDFDDPFYGLLGMAFDAGDFLYAVDAAPPRVIRLDTRTGAQSDYASFEDVPLCSPGGSGQCSPTSLDMKALPDYPVFAPDGTMYVTDLNQALIWRVPPGGGEAEVWFSDPGFETLFGPNGIQFLAGGTTLLVVLSTQSNPASPVQRLPGLYELPVEPDGSPGALTQRWVAGLSDVPDGFALGQSGNAYVPLAGVPTGNAVAVVAPDGTLIARTPANEIQNQMLEVPFDQPASAAFLGESVLVTNHALFSRNPDSYAVLDVFAGEPGLPLYRPDLSGPRLGPGGDDSAIRLAVKPRRAIAGRKTCFRFRVKGAGGGPIPDALVRFAGKRKTSDAQGRSRVCKRLENIGKRTATARAGVRTARAKVRVLRSPL